MPGIRSLNRQETGITEITTSTIGVEDTQTEATFGLDIRALFMQHSSASISANSLALDALDRPAASYAVTIDQDLTGITVSNVLSGVQVQVLIYFLVDGTGGHAFAQSAFTLGGATTYFFSGGWNPDLSAGALFRAKLTTTDGGSTWHIESDSQMDALLQGIADLSPTAANQMLVSTGTDTPAMLGIGSSQLVGRRSTGIIAGIQYSDARLDLGVVRPNSATRSSGYNLTTADSTNKSAPTSIGGYQVFAGTTNTVTVPQDLQTYSAAEPLTFILWNQGTGTLTVAAGGTVVITPPTGFTSAVVAGGMAILRQSATNAYGIAGALVAA